MYAFLRALCSESNLDINSRVRPLLTSSLLFLDTRLVDEKYDIILFCHSMYGMSPKRSFIERAIQLLTRDGIVVIYHREGLKADYLSSHRTVSFPTGIVRVGNDDKTLNCFAPFIAGFTMQEEGNQRVWRETCDNLGGRNEAYPDDPVFCAPEVLVTFTRHVTALPELTALVPMMNDRPVKNR
jgi:hypothetical protein